MSVAIIIFCALSVAALLYAEQNDNARLRWLAKPAASAAFIALAVAVGALDGGAFGLLILAGLILCALGDIFLIPRKEAMFLGGMGAFAAGHAAYALAFWRQAPAMKPGVYLAAVGMVVASALVLRTFRDGLGAMRLPVAFYMAIISFMVVMSVAASPLDGLYDWRLIAGALGFAISDISVARDQFGHRAFINRAWGLPLYYASQLLLASSV